LIDGVGFGCLPISRLDYAISMPCLEPNRQRKKIVSARWCPRRGGLCSRRFRLKAVHQRAQATGS
jgi:hypothetical protein